MSEILDPKRLNNTALVSEFKALVRSERKITTDILTFIKEVDRRRLYLEYNCTSLFGFLTQEMGYPKASAQRCIDSARLLGELPEMKKDIESGALNLSQILMVAQSLRQEKKEKPDAHAKTQFEKREILNLIKNKDMEQSQKTIAQILDLKIMVPEKKKFQKDESLRIEMTFSKDETELLNRVKELISHINPNPTMAELVTFLARAYVQRKDPLIKKSIRQAKSIRQEKHAEQLEQATGIEPAVEREKVVMSRKIKTSSAPEPQKSARTPIKAIIKREIFQRDQAWRWKDPQTNKICGSRFQLQIDHKHPVWAGGGNDPQNLQLLCRIHNALKYEREVDLV